MASISFGQDLATLARSCAPGADYTSLKAIVLTESSARPYALSLNYPTATVQHGLPRGHMWLANQPSSREQAERWARTLIHSGFTLSIGLMQVSTEAGYAPGDLLDPCANVRIGWKIFTQKYQDAVSKYGPGQRAVQTAISLYNSGSMTAGFRNGYVGKVLANAKENSRY